MYVLYKSSALYALLYMYLSYVLYALYIWYILYVLYKINSNGKDNDLSDSIKFCITYFAIYKTFHIFAYAALRIFANTTKIRVQ